MRRHAAALLAALTFLLGPLWDGAAMAQPLPLRSGEHASFTRLTLPLPAGTGWQVGRTDGGYGVRLSDEGLAIDTSTTFARIPRTRLAALRTAPGRVDLVLGCECHARAFVDSGLLVIDIHDGAPPPGARFETPLGGPVAAIPAERPAFDWIRSHLLASPARLASDPRRTEAAANTLAAGLSPESRLRIPPPDEASDIARTLLLRHFARAAAQGLIGADLAALTDPRQADATRSAPPPPPAAIPPELPPDPLRNLRIDAETAMDRAWRQSLRPGLRPDGGACIGDEAFALADWADDRPAGVQFADARRGLVGEFDMPDPEAVLRLARLYLHFGFGAEARSLLEALARERAEAPLLSDLARLIDEALPLPGSQVTGMEGCDGAVALWAVLAAESPRPDPATDRAAVTRAFSALPSHLRHHLGPTLVQRFLSVGDADTAWQLRNAIGRAAGETSAALDLVDADLAMARGAPEEASETLAPLASGNAPSAGEALAGLVEARLAAGLPLDAALSETLAARAHEYRGTALGARLARLEALELAMSGSFDAAFSVRDRLRRHDPDGPLAALEEELTALLVANADEETFLARIFTEGYWRDGALRPALRQSLATRLLAAGFAAEALAALPEADRRSDADRLLLARAALALGDAQRALRGIAGMEGEEAARLRGTALAALGDQAAAAAAFGSAGQTAEAAHAAWLAGDWETAARLGEGSMAEVSGRLAATTPAIGAAPAGTPVAEPGLADADGMAPDVAASPDGELSAARAMMTDSAAMRALLEALLAQYPAPPGR
mgnify:CR=1 FL=1